jgi:TctA family transporter
MLFALLPGLSGVALMALAIPLTLSWDPLPTMMFFGAMVGGGTFMGSVTAILFNVPGSSPNAATVLDGYPLATKGEAKTAIACSATASALGATIGIVALIVLLPFTRTVILSFGPPEFVLLAVWGLATIATVSKESMLKGLIAAGLGLMFSFVGYDPRTAEARYTFGSDYLSDGLATVPVFLGFFAVAEIFNLIVSGKSTISGQSDAQLLTGSSKAGILAVFRNFSLFLRASVIGTVIGMIPGIGGTAASFVAYGHAAQTATEPRRFGEGDLRGVLAPEAANDAKDGGSLLPVLAFGIPGSEGTVLLLAVLFLHGITPGPELMTNQLHLVFVLIWSLFLANWLTSILGIAASTRLSWMTVIRTQTLAPFILFVVVLGACAVNGRYQDLLVTVLFGAFGYGFKRYGWPRVPFVIALVLGGLFETNLQLSLQLHEFGRLDFLSRPVFLSLSGLLVLTLVVSVIRLVKDQLPARVK